MTSRGLTALLFRTVAALVVAVIVLVIVGWSWLGTLAVGLVASAALVQLGGVFWLRRREEQPGHSDRKPLQP